MALQVQRANAVHGACSGGTIHRSEAASRTRPARVSPLHHQKLQWAPFARGVSSTACAAASVLRPAHGPQPSTLRSCAAGAATRRAAQKQLPAARTQSPQILRTTQHTPAWKPGYACVPVRTHAGSTTAAARAKEFRAILKLVRSAADQVPATHTQALPVDRRRTGRAEPRNRLCYVMWEPPLTERVHAATSFPKLPPQPTQLRQAEPTSGVASGTEEGESTQHLPATEQRQSYQFR